MSEDQTPRTFREVGIVNEYFKEEIAEIKRDIDNIKKGLKQIVVVLITGLLFPVLAGIILAAILGLRGS